MAENTNKFKKLILGLFFDAIGYASYIFPGVGEFFDIIWAPLSGWLMTRLYKGKAGQIAGVIAFTEELLPGIDFIPSFTLMWIYTYLLKGKDKKNTITITP